MRRINPAYTQENVRRIQAMILGELVISDAARAGDGPLASYSSIVSFTIDGDDTPRGGETGSNLVDFVGWARAHGRDKHLPPTEVLVRLEAMNYRSRAAGEQVPMSEIDPTFKGPHGQVS